MIENGLNESDEEALARMAELLARKAWLREQAPAMSDEVCDQLAALHPVEVVPKASPGIYLDRVAVMPAAVAYRGKSGVRYVALTWPVSGDGRERVLRLYIDLPTGEAFLAERPFSRAKEVLDVRPGLPFFIRRGVEDFIRLHTPRS